MKRIVNAIGIAAFMAACTTGVSNNIESKNAAYVVTTRSSLANSLICFEKEASKLPFRYDAEQQSNNWTVNFQVYGGAVTGWFDKGLVINNDNTLSFFADAADFGFDAFGLKAAVVPIMDACR